MTRREFVASSAVAAAQPAGARFVKGICATAFPKEMEAADFFSTARNAGFDAVELRLGQGVTLASTNDQIDRLREAATKARVSIASLWVSEGLGSNPLNSADAAVRAKGVEAIQRAVDIAVRLGCDAMLLVPGRLGNGGKLVMGYEDTWKLITAELRKVIPYAASKKVCLTPENVWNKFLVSPLEMRAFVDQFKSPYLQTHFDVGNVMQFGYPQDWILTLGSRIRRVHLKDYKLSQRSEQGRFVDLLEGDVDWPAVMAALVKVGYRGALSPEYGFNAQDADYLKKMSRATDKIIAMAA